MKRFTKTDLTQNISAVIRETFKSPVVITDRRKDSHILMTIEDYKELTKDRPEKVLPTLNQD